MANSSIMKFPIIVISEDGKRLFWSYYLHRLKKTNLYTLQSGQFKQSFFIDSMYKRYDVIKVHKKRIIKPYFDVILFNPNLEIDFDISEREQLDLETTRKIVIETLRNEGIRKKKIFALISSAESVHQIIQALVECFTGTYGLDVPSE